ncbi:hypothetical protein PVK06_024795 [Gossypium arboreum]|uniref:Uncharacterized protein n=1 Tax=Gossypium arboreum TaxID=29729 RepID=A0ABR0PEM8_GOSAR|nr:hypothetical protein PVK06_024795 [Gossypium arboreum]
MQVWKIHLITKRGKHGNNWEVVHRKYIAVWDSRMARRPQMNISFDLQPSLEYIQWYSTTGKIVLYYGKAIFTWWAVDCSPPHMQQPEAYEPVADIEAELEPKQDPKPKPKPEPELELKPKP